MVAKILPFEEDVDDDDELFIINVHLDVLKQL